jgi:hypothetical protein
VTSTNAHTIAGAQSGPGLTLVHPHILTSEFLLAYETGAFAGYCRTHCGLCRAFVMQLRTPVEFRSLKAFFPFIRIASVLEFPRTQENLPAWLRLAFQAGLELGHAHPEAADLLKARASLTAFKQLLDGIAPPANELEAAFAQLAESQWPHIDPLEMNQVYCETAVRAMRAGYLAATLAQTDPCLAGFSAELPRTTPGETDLVHRALCEACTFEWEAALIYRMEHPLLRLARQLHPHEPAKQERLLANIHGILIIRDERGGGSGRPPRPDPQRRSDRTRRIPRTPIGTDAPRTDPADAAPRTLTDRVCLSRSAPDCQRNLRIIHATCSICSHCGWGQPRLYVGNVTCKG